MVLGWLLVCHRNLPLRLVHLRHTSADIDTDPVPAIAAHCSAVYKSQVEQGYLLEVLTFVTIFSNRLTKQGNVPSESRLCT